MPIIREMLYWPEHLRDRVKHVAQQFQQEELKRNLAETDLRDAIIVCISEALPKVEKMVLHFKQRVDELKARANYIRTHL